jgi:Mn-dependent DtxR family transcriptional regulator
MSEPLPAAVLDAVRDADKPFVSTSDVAAEFETVSRKTVVSRLNRLAAEDRLEKETIGGAAVWWITCP